jgi:hypothetical protein
MRLRPDDADRLLRFSGRLPQAAVTIAGGNVPPAEISYDTATDPPCASALPRLCQHEQEKADRR